jgi:type I restriction enzyme S subunit
MSEWTTGHLSDLVAFEKGKKVETAREEKTGWLPYLGASAIEGYVDNFANPSGGVVASCSDVLMLWDGERSGLVGRGSHGVVASTVAKLAPKCIDAGFLYHSLFHKFTWIQARRTGTSVPHVPSNLGTWLSISFPLNELEQKTIAQVLDTLDTQIRQTEALIAKLERIKQGLLTDLLTRGIDQNGQLRPTPDQAPCLYKDSPLGRIPNEWRLGKLGDYLLGSPKNGYSPQEAGSFTGRIMLGLGCLTPSGFSANQLKNAPRNDPQVDRAQLTNGDLLITRANTRDLVGLVGIYRDIGYPCSYPDLMMKLTPAPCTSAEFLELALGSSRLRQQIQSAASGTSGSMVKISGATVKKLLIAMPSNDEQSRILHAISYVRKRLQTETDALGVIQRTKRGLMDDLLTGRVRVTQLLESTNQAHG